MEGRISKASIIELRYQAAETETSCSIRPWEGDRLLLYLNDLVVTEQVIGGCMPSLSVGHDHDLEYLMNVARGDES